MKEAAKAEEKSWRSRVWDTLRRHAGTAVFIVTAAVLVMGWFRTDLEGARPSLSLALPPIVGGFCGLCVIRKWTVWLAVTLFGLVIGLVSALQLYLGPEFIGQYRVGFLTLAFYFALGVIFGAASEFIRYLHRLSHDLAAKAPASRK